MRGPRGVRVIAGTAKGRMLRVPRCGTRPTPARVREAVFSWVAAYVAGAHVLDVFAGTGALGLEALSRGASHGVFVETNPQALACLRRNTSIFASQTTLLAMPAVRALHKLQHLRQTFDLIFLDPPYPQACLKSMLDRLAAGRLLSDSGIIVCEHPTRRDAPEASDTATHAYACLARRSFGDVSISLFGF